MNQGLLKRPGLLHQSKMSWQNCDHTASFVVAIVVVSVVVVHCKPVGGVDKTFVRAVSRLGRGIASCCCCCYCC